MTRALELDAAFSPLCTPGVVAQVTKKTFMKTLREKGSVMCCPGGQAELVHTHRSFRPLREWVIITHHKGQPHSSHRMSGTSAVSLLAHEGTSTVRGRCLRSSSIQYRR